MKLQRKREISNDNSLAGSVVQSSYFGGNSIKSIDYLPVTCYDTLTLFLSEDVFMKNQSQKTPCSIALLAYV